MIRNVLQAPTFIWPVLCWLSYALVCTSDIGPDHTAQAWAAQNLIGGHGLTVPTFHADGPEVLSREPLWQWPPLVSWVYAGFLVFDVDIWVAQKLILLIMAGFYCLAWHDVLNLLRHERAMTRENVTVFWVLWTIGFIPLLAMGPSDLMAATCIAFATGAAFRAARATSRLSWVYAVLNVGFVILACLARYAYYPLLLMGPATLFGLALVDKPRRSSLLQATFAGALVATVGLAMLSWTQRASTFVNNFYSEWTFHPEYLMRLDPFIASALGFWQVLEKMAYKMPQADLVCRIIAHGVSLAFGLWMCRWLLSAWNAGWRERVLQRPGTVTLALYGAVCSLLIVAMLCYLTVRTDFQDWLPGGWTYVMETRYYVILFPFVTLAATVPIVRAMEGRYSSKTLCKSAVVALVAVLSVGGLHRAWMVLKDVTDREGLVAAQLQRREEWREIRQALRRNGMDEKFVCYIRDTGQDERVVKRHAALVGAICLSRDEAQLVATRWAQRECLILWEDHGGDGTSRDQPCEGLGTPALRVPLRDGRKILGAWLLRRPE